MIGSYVSASMIRYPGLLLLVLGFGALTGRAGEVIRVRADPWMPFNGGTAEAPGYVIEVMQTIFRPHGIEIDYASLPWDEALAGCREGKIDAVPCANAKEGEGLTFPSLTIADVKYSIFTLKESTWRLTSDASFKGHKLGWAEGYSYWDGLDRYIATKPEGLVLISGDDTAWDGMQKLIKREIDLLPECPQVFYWTLKNHGVDPKLFRVACLMPGDPVFVVFRPDAKGRAWAKLLDEGLQKLRASGELKKILGKYGVDDWQ